MVLNEKGEGELELWQIAKVRIEEKELLDFWRNIINDLEEENEEIEDTEIDFLIQLRRSAPIEWKHNINVNTTLTKYSRFKRVLWALYRPIENGEIVRIVKEKVKEVIDYIEYDEQLRPKIIKKEVYQEKIIDNRRKLVNFLAQITSDSEEQYQLLYFYCWSKELKEQAVKPHQDIRHVRKRKEKEKKIKKIIELRRKGLSIRKIAEIVGLSKSTVQRILSKVENKND